MKQYTRGGLGIFSLDFEIFQRQKSITPASLETLLSDLFPYFQKQSLIGFIIVINLLIWIVTLYKPDLLTIYPGEPLIYKIIHLFLSPFACRGQIIQLLGYFIFLATIGAYLQRKIGSRKFIIQMYLSGVLGTLFSHLLFLSIPICSSTKYYHLDHGIYSLYLLSLIKQDTQTSKWPQKIYKFILFSFIIYSSSYNKAYTNIFTYIGGFLSLLICRQSKRYQKQTILT